MALPIDKTENPFPFNLSLRTHPTPIVRESIEKPRPQPEPAAPNEHLHRSGKTTEALTKWGCLKAMKGTKSWIRKVSKFT